MFLEWLSSANAPCGCGRCFNCNSTLQLYPRNPQATCWPAGIDSPKLYFELRARQLLYQQLHFCGSWRPAESNTRTVSQLRSARQQPQLRVAIPDSYTNIPPEDTSICYVRSLQLSLVKKPQPQPQQPQQQPPSSPAPSSASPPHLAAPTLALATAANASWRCPHPCLASMEESASTLEQPLLLLSSCGGSSSSSFCSSGGCSSRRGNIARQYWVEQGAACPCTRRHHIVRSTVQFGSELQCQQRQPLDKPQVQARFPLLGGVLQQLRRRHAHCNPCDKASEGSPASVLPLLPGVSLRSCAVV